MLLPHDGLTIPDEVYVPTFFNSLSVHDQGVLKAAYEEIKQKRPSFSEGIKSNLLVVLMVAGNYHTQTTCRELVCR